MKSIFSLFIIIFIITLSFINCGGKKNGENKDSLKTKSDNSNLKTYVWFHDMCEYKGYYDSIIYKKEILDNLYNLWQGNNMTLSDYTSIFDFRDTNKLNIDSLNIEYKRIKKHIQNIKIIEIPLWQNLRKARIKELDTIYETQKSYIEGFKNPKQLLNNKYSNFCKEFAEALASDNKQDLLDEWKNFIKNINNPITYEKYLKQSKTPEKYLYAKIHLMTFGWWNCCNHFIKYVEKTEEMEKEFNKFFIKVEPPDCEYVD
jgi:hypothetical protein